MDLASNCFPKDSSLPGIRRYCMHCIHNFADSSTTGFGNGFDIDFVDMSTRSRTMDIGIQNLNRNRCKGSKTGKFRTSSVLSL